MYFFSTSKTLIYILINNIINLGGIKMEKIVIDKMIKKHLSLRGWTTQELADKLGEDESIILGCMAGSLQPKMGTVQKLKYTAQGHTQSDRTIAKI